MVSGYCLHSLQMTWERTKNREPFERYRIEFNAQISYNGSLVGVGIGCGCGCGCGSS